MRQRVARLWLDLVTFRARTGDTAFNTTWEALALLVAVRLWEPTAGAWLVSVRSDSLSTLLSVSNQKATAPGLRIISRELALLTAESGLTLVGLTHVPGMANEWADALSRLHAPDPKGVPAPLRGLPVQRPPPRTPEWWRARAPAQKGGGSRRC